MAEMTTRSAGEIIQWRYFGEVLIEVPADIQQQATEGADPARLPGCVLQAAFGYQRDNVFRTANLCNDWPGRKSGVAAIDWHWSHEFDLHVRRLVADRHTGRRTLLYIGSFGYIVSLGLCSWAFYTEHFAIVPGPASSDLLRHMPWAREL